MTDAPSVTHTSDEGSFFTGFGCYAEFDGTEGQSLTINSFSSECHQTRKALAWLRERYPYIAVWDAGNSAEDESFKFWAHMAQTGAIDEILDPNQEPIFKDGQWLPHEDGWAIDAAA